MKIEEIEIPNEWCEILAETQKHDPKAIIGGGAIRDKFIGHEPKDLDLFVFSPPSIPDFGMSELGFDYEGMKYVLSVNKYSTNPLPINVIGIEKNVEVIGLLNSFDFGICQIAFDGKRIIRTPAFDWDFKHSIMTMYHVDRYSRSIDRYCRIGRRLNLKIAIPKLDEINKKEKESF